MTSFVPYNSEHPRHTLRNLPRCLFNRAFTLNLIDKEKNLAFAKIDDGLTVLNYPRKIIQECKNTAEKIIPSKYIPICGKFDKKILYLVITNNHINKKNPLHNDIAILNRILHKDQTGFLNNVHVLSFCASQF